jgi:TetR/AcrR family transcriptional regulator, transcriptional repressor for nem operon
MARQKEFDPDLALEKALEIFWRQGFTATSMQDLVDGMGVGRGSLYETFGSKEALFAKAIDKYSIRALTLMTATIEQSEEPIEAIRGLLQQIAKGSSNDAPCGCFLVNTTVELASHDDALAAQLRTGWGRLEQAFMRGLRRAQKAGDLPATKDPRALSRFLVNTIHGLGVGAKYQLDRRRARDVIDVALDALT